MHSGQPSPSIALPSLWRSAGLVALASAFFVVWVLLKPGTHDQFVTGDNLAQLLGNLLGLALCYLPLHGRPWRHSTHAQSGAARLALPRGARRWAPVLLSLAILSEAIGQAIYTYIQDIQHRAVMFPSWADAVYLCVYPFALLGILLLAHRPLSLAARMRVFFDGLMLMTGALTFSWYFILGPTVLQSGQTPLEAAVGGAYPVGDLLLTVCLLLLAARASDGHLRQAVGLLALALGVIVVTDSIYDFQLLHGGYSTGSILDVGWCLGYSLLGLGTLAYRRADALNAAPRDGHAADAGDALPSAPSLWRALLPYALVPAVAGLVIFVRWGHGDPTLKPGVYLGAVVLIALVLLRQVMAVRETIAANAALRAMYNDNAALTAANTQLEVMATTDALTGLFNRPLLQERLEQTLRAARREGQPLALLLMDLDRFKEVNDTLGHHYGDLLLQQIGPRLQGLLRSGDLVARLGGDEFAVLLPGAEEFGATRVAQAILRTLESPFHIEGQSVDVGASIGVALHPAHGVDAETLLRCADVAMYVAKRTHAGVTVYDPAQDQHSAHRLTLMSDLRQALADDALLLHYQPKVDRSSGRLTGVEVLLRWQHPEHGLIPPDHFIPLAEHTGLIGPLTHWVIETALRQNQSWQRRALALNIAINLSARVLHDTTLPDLLQGLLRRYDCPPERVTVEITESALMVDPTRALEVLGRLTALGVHISIDDFGTGYSSLGYLKRLPVDEVKIDKSFVFGMDSNAKDAALVRSIIAMAHALGLAVVAEGVETAEAWDLLRALGCDTVQGYYLSRPLPATELELWAQDAPWGQPPTLRTTPASA